MSSKVTPKDMVRGNKRVNITLSLSEFDDLYIVAEAEGFSVTSYCKSLVIGGVADKLAALRRKKYVRKSDRGENLFTQQNQGKLNL